MNPKLKNVLCGALALCVAAQPVQAALMTLATQPLFLGASIPPQVMLTMTKDQQLFKKAYNDYSDLDNDGALETTYKHSIAYYGYFDSSKCYDYNTTNRQFEPFGITADKYCTGANAAKWSGNFLNWASMTRMDAVRKLLYGGLRSTDTASATVLERAYLPSDAHSFAKHYAGTDINQLTPFTVNTTAPLATSVTNHTTTTGSKTWTMTTTGVQIGHQIRATATGGPANGQVLTGNVTAVTGTTITVSVDAFTGASGNNGNSWNLENMSMVGISFCNTTLGGQTAPLGTGLPVSGSVEARSQSNPNPPLLRAVSGNYALWAANERFQCYFQGETTNPARSTSLGGTRSNGNRAGLSGLFAASFEPTTGANGLGPVDHVVRVQACVSALLGAERCKEYDQSNVFKPIGLLQLYGDPGLINFGLLTGSYSKNISGGVLRKNVLSFTDEVAANGTFVTPAGGGIVNTLNKLRIIGYHYHEGLYNNAYPNGDSCAFQLVNITEGNCRSWGNPMSEIYFESLRYFSGQTAPTAAFATTNDSTLITGLGTATWPATSTQVLSSSNFCAPLNVLVFNSSISTNEDTGQIGSLAVINSAQTVQTLTTTVGNSETGADQVSGTNLFFYGKTPTLASTDAGFELCSAKTAPGGGLGDVVGICPEGPTLGGTYHMAGLAYHAKTNRIRTDIAVPASDTKSLKVTTYGINLSTNVPSIPIKVTGDVNPRAVIQPIYRLFNAAPFGGGALVDLKIVSQTVTATASSGSVYLNWEDSEQGGDYDQDMWGLINYCMQVNGDTTSCPQNGGVTNTISVTTDAIAESTGNPQGFGYVISGTTQDGPHFHSGIENFNFSETQLINIYNAAGTQINGTGNITGNGGCVSCDLGDGPTTARYTLSTSGTARNLKDPLFYTAKFGGFKDSNGNNLPDLQSEWDVLLADGSVGTDNNPDNYFLVSNPLGLETALNKVFLTILQTASASSVATNSTSLNVGTKIYQARFNANDWSGQLLAFPVNADGTVSTTSDFDSGQLMNPTLTPTFDFSTQVLVTYNKGIAGSPPSGIPFRWPANPAAPTVSEITPAMVTALKTNPATSTVESDTIGGRRLNFLRGDGTFEGAAVGDFRRRQTSKLGDIINSNPTFVGPPNAGHGDAAYAAFRQTHISRTPIIYAAAGDGFVHGFDGGTSTNKGKRVFGYMPSKALLKANKLTNPGYVHEYYVDGSPEVQDACTAFTSGVCTTWRTMLAVAMGAGGQSVSLLDITDPAAVATGFIESNAANLVKWEFTDADDPDLGFTVGQPLIRRMANGKWAVIVSGGYNNSLGDGAVSTSGNAVLFILFVAGPTGANGAWVSGTDYIKITTGVGTSGTPAGLAPPFAADIDSDGLVDFIYAGENEGGFWKFDVRSTTPTNWSLPANRVKLFQAIDGSGIPQPITAAAEGTSHVSGTGFMINFGTGKYIEPNDVSPPGPAYTPQSYYGIWDRNDGPVVLGVQNVSLQTTVTRAQLYQQQILADVQIGTPARLAHVSSGSTPCTPAGACSPNYVLVSPIPAGPPEHQGWFLDWANSTPNLTTTDKSPPTGERTVFAPQIVNGRLIFTTLLPNAASCLFGGDSVTMVLDNQTGARFEGSPFDTNGDGQFNTSDLVNVGGVFYAVSGISSGVGITGSPTVIKFGSGAGAGGATPGGYLGGYVGGSGSGAALYNTWLAILSGSSSSTASVLLDLGVNSIGRLNWREVTAD